MAYIKIFPIKVTDKKALDYITNPDKTDEKLLVSSFGCSPETADLEFAMTRESAKKNGMDKGNNLAFHLIQSFKPGEVDAETAHRLGQQFADEVLKGKYEYVISTHVDKNHIHNHIIFNAASFVDHHKYCRISGCKCLDLRIGERRFVHIFTASDRCFAGHDLGNELLLVLNQLPHITVECGFCYIPEDMNLFIMVSLTDNTSFPL